MSVQPYASRTARVHRVVELAQAEDAGVAFVAVVKAVVGGGEAFVPGDDWRSDALLASCAAAPRLRGARWRISARTMSACSMALPSPTSSANRVHVVR